MICRNLLRQLGCRPLVVNAPSMSKTSQSRTISLLAPRRPLLASSSLHHSINLVPQLPRPGAAGVETIDLLPKISASPILASIQVRHGPRNTYNMTHFVRKRRHGFLCRIRTRKGQALLKRRRAKGRKNLSH